MVSNVLEVKFPFSSIPGSNLVFSSLSMFFKFIILAEMRVSKYISYDQVRNQLLILIYPAWI